jgi:hypothetical protein
MRKIISIIIFSILVVESYAQFSKVGTAGLQFLKIGVEPRGAGMAGAYSALSDDATGLYWNPAGIALVNRPGLVVSDVEWFADIRNTFLGYVLPRGDAGTFGLSITALTMASEDVNTEALPDGSGFSWSASDIAVGLSWAKMFLPEFSFGATAKLIQERIWDITGTSIAFDLGAYVNPKIFGSLRAAFVIKNFGSDIVYSGGQLAKALLPSDYPPGTGPIDVELLSGPVPLPLQLKFGIAYDFVAAANNRLTGALELTHPNDGAEKIHLGVEYELLKTLALRVGYVYDPDKRGYTISADSSGTAVETEEAGFGSVLEGPSFGVGVSRRIGRTTCLVNYAGEVKKWLGLQHRVSLGFSF